MTLKEQQYVCTLAKCQTISKASEELYISQPALSTYISNLEKYLGVKLFERTGKSFILTSIGEEYVKRAEQMLQLKEEFEFLLEQESGRGKGSIRIGIQQRRAITMAPYIVSRFIKEYPDVNLVFKEGVHDELVKMYLNNSLDFLVCVYRDELPDAEYIELGEEQVLLALPKSHAANKHEFYSDGGGRHLNLGYLDRETFILPAKDQSMRKTAERIFEQFEIKPGRIIEISNFETAMAMVEQEVGIGFNRAGYLSTMPCFENINYYLVGESPYCSKVVIAYRKGRILPPHMERLLELLKECGTTYNYVVKNV